MLEFIKESKLNVKKWHKVGLSKLKYCFFMFVFCVFLSSERNSPEIQVDFSVCYSVSECFMLFGL